MRYEVKSAKQVAQYRANVTVMEKTDAGVETGREWTEPFDTQKKDFAELKGRFATRIQDDNSRDAAEAGLITELKNAGLETV